MLNYAMDVNPDDGPSWLSENLVKVLVLVLIAVLVAVMAIFVISQAQPQL
jgi:hypothetical protein